MRGDAFHHRDLPSSNPDSALPQLDLSVPPSRFSDSHTKRETPGHFDEKVAGNGIYYKTSAEVSTNLRRRPFFLVYTCYWLQIREIPD